MAQAMIILGKFGHTHIHTHTHTYIYYIYIYIYIYKQSTNQQTNATNQYDTIKHQTIKY